MSQDNEKCAKCGKPCGYDDDKGYWDGECLALCGQCRNNLISRFSAFFGLDGCSCDYYGLDIEWVDVDKILSHIKKDELYRVSYIVTDKELYERTKTVETPIEEVNNE